MLMTAGIQASGQRAASTAMKTGELPSGRPRARETSRISRLILYHQNAPRDSEGQQGEDPERDRVADRRSSAFDLDRLSACHLHSRPLGGTIAGNATPVCPASPG